MIIIYVIAYIIHCKSSACYENLYFGLSLSTTLLRIFFKCMLHFKVIFIIMIGPDNPGQVDLQAWMGWIKDLRSNTKNFLQIPYTYLKRFDGWAFCAWAPRLWNELPDNIKAADSVQNFKTQLKTLAISKGIYFTICTINICLLFLRSAFDH